MNQRIRELKKQAFVKAHWSEDGERFIHDHFDMDKFALLIVQECAKAVEDSIWHLPRGYKAVDQAKFVKQHFGVEE